VLQSCFKCLSVLDMGCGQLIVEGKVKVIIIVSHLNDLEFTDQTDAGEARGRN
jgi:hypothetical protein